MCGRYTLTKLENALRNLPFVKSAPAEADAEPPRFNIAPTQPVLAVANNHPGRLERFHWGLIPSWAKDPSIGSRLINARAETLAEKPAFRTAFRRRRCLVPADGFYEWRVDPGGKTKTPMYIRLKGGKPFAFAGLWDVWHDPGGGEIPSLTLVTGEPNELVKPIHDRMVVILRPEDYQRWLEPAEQEAEKLREMLKPYPAEEMEAFPVSRLVNSPKNDVPQCIESITAGEADSGGLFGL